MRISPTKRLKKGEKHFLQDKIKSIVILYLVYIVFIPFANRLLYYIQGKCIVNRVVESSMTGDGRLVYLMDHGSTDYRSGDLHILLVSCI